LLWVYGINVGVPSFYFLAPLASNVRLLTVCVVPYFSFDEHHADGSRYGDTMLPIFDIVNLTHLMNPDRFPTLGIQSKPSIHPAIAQVFLERTEVLIKILCTMDGANNIFHADIVNAFQMLAK
jgi:hypothetical protein